MKTDMNLRQKIFRAAVPLALAASLAFGCNRAKPDPDRAVLESVSKDAKCVYEDGEGHRRIDGVVSSNGRDTDDVGSIKDGDRSFMGGVRVKVIKKLARERFVIELSKQAPVKNPDGTTFEVITKTVPMCEE
jgi:hypothetical protein